MSLLFFFFFHYCTLRENAPKLVCLKKILSLVILGWRKPGTYLDTSKTFLFRNLCQFDIMLWTMTSLPKKSRTAFTSFSHWLWYIAVYAFGFWPRNKWIYDLQPQYYGRTFRVNLIDNCRKWALVWNSSSQDPFCWCNPPKIPKWTSRKEKNKNNAKEAYAKWFFFAE